MEQIIARLTSFIGGFLVRTDDRVADGAFGMTFEGAGDVLLESR